MKSIKLLLSSALLFSIVSEGCKESSEDKSKNDVKVENKKDATNSSPLLTVTTIKIGNQEWMTEDIKTITYNNGDPVSEAKTEKQWKTYGENKTGCYRLLKNGAYVYNGFAIKDIRGLVPEGFEIPSFEKFKQLFTFLGGGDSQSGKATKSMATYPLFIEDWVGDQETGGLETVEVASNGSSGFNAKNGGFVYDHGALDSEGSCSFWWTSSSEQSNIIVVDIGHCSQDLGGGKGSYPLNYGFSLRAIKK